MNSSIKLGLALALVSGLLGALGAWTMATRIQSFNRAEAASARWHFERIDARSTTFAGRKLTITDTRSDQDTSAMKIQYGDTIFTLDVKEPPAALPDLSAYTEWLSPLFFAPIKDGEISVDWTTGDGVRLAIVNRTTAGYDERTWGSVRVKDWIFDVIELKTDGTIDRKRMQYRDRRGRLPASINEKGETVQTDIIPIEERTWQWQAALFAVPRLQISRYRYGSDAVQGTLNTPGMGWTLPVTGLAAMGLFVGVVMVMAGSVTRKPRPKLGSGVTV